MRQIAYFYLRGLPFIRQGVTLSPASTVSPSRAPQAVLRRGRIFDIDSTAAAAGVLLSSHLRQAKQVCPDLETKDFDIAQYEACARPFVSLLRRETNRIEFDGPNALFVDFAGGGDPTQVARGLLSGFPGFEIVAGIAGSKFTARAAVLAVLGAVTYNERPMFMSPPVVPVSRMDGAGQGRHIPPVLTLADMIAGGRQGEIAFLSALPIGYLWPVSEEIRERLYRLGIKTCGELSRVSRRELGRLFGADGQRLADLAQGEDRDCVCPAYSRDEIVRRVDFDGPISGKIALRSSLEALGQDLGESLRAELLGCRSLTLALRLDDGADLTRERVFSRPQGDPRTIGAAAAAMLESMRVHRPVLGVEVIGASLERDHGRQLSFLPDAAVTADQQSSLLRTVTFLERRFPGGVVKIGASPASRRERMLALVDPIRRYERGAPSD
jgi:hypothetical protein